MNYLMYSIWLEKKGHAIIQAVSLGLQTLTEVFGFILRIQKLSRFLERIYLMFNNNYSTDSFATCYFKIFRQFFFVNFELFVKLQKMPSNSKSFNQSKCLLSFLLFFSFSEEFFFPWKNSIIKLLKGVTGSAVLYIPVDTKPALNIHEILSVH